jgi:hypothetical protein
MKKVSLVFIILTFFYNVLGYYVMFVEKKQQTWVNTMEKMDNSKFEVIKLKINPYAFVYDSGFENVNQDVSFNNINYHVFKNRIIKNVLYLYCIKNTNKTVLSKELKNNIDNQLFDGSTKENPAKKLLKSFQKDYISENDFCFDFKRTNNFRNKSVLTYILQRALFSGYSKTNYPPPEFA